MRNFEEQLWNYVDGTCTPQEREVIEHLIATDEAYRLKFEEIKAFNLELQDIELDAPPMAFTYNVMEQVRAEEAQKPLKSSINTMVIKGIAAFFVLTITTLVVIALANANWSAGAANQINVPIIRTSELKNLFSGNVLNGFLFFDLVLALYFFDSYLRKRKISEAV
ncbi:hypothetical protein [uncultured Mucilaginibacter sp.]|uniref:anti-sigma factor family protein n=1 Tax=uncultured Mucilaginibacter sp. TaxID=797541 RepID=UPI0025EC05A8|nr:hypothetical protein [uncultured Mucilaginibacter sp.]